MLRQALTLSLTAIAVSACAATASSSSTSSHQYVPPLANSIVQPAARDTSNLVATELTLKQIMADPDWMGRSPQSEFWSTDSQSVMYYQKVQGSSLNNLMRQPLSGQGEKVRMEQRHEYESNKGVWNQDHSHYAYVFEGDIFVKSTKDGKLTQVTRSLAKEASPQFLLDGRLAYRYGLDYFAVDLKTGLSQQLVSLKTADKPKGVDAPSTYIAKEQHKLIQYVAKKHQQAKERQSQSRELQSKNSSRAAKAFYFGKKNRVVEASLSPKGDRMIVAVTESKPWRDKTDIMPNYVTQDGTIAAQKVRRRVADSKPVEHILYVLDLKRHAKSVLTYNTLPGFDEDVLASVKEENAKAEGREYQSQKQIRAISLMEDWYWSQSPVQWNATGEKVAVMLKSWDNKDRWIATVDFGGKKLVHQHREHDDAWVNYKHNSFGWLNQSDELYYLSEDSGYAHLYLKSPGKKAKALTQGEYVVDHLTLTRDDSKFYFKANRKHPGIYDIFSVSPQSGELVTYTDLNGMTDYQLSPDESKLLLKHSKVVSPPELYVQDAQPQAKAVKLTDTVSPLFKSMPWIAPEVVPVPSSHTDKPIYARVYKPANLTQGEKRRAVIFNHGAGYLQNSHLGWSVYFREFMFHSMLAQQGYVVMDMDYRASMGYGRDWRTAIYRQMGTPEIQDLADGVDYMVKNLNVDRQRVGTYGGSYGGFMTFMALFKEPELFQAGAALRPVSDWAYYNTGYTSDILNTPDLDPIAYRRSSPIYFAEGLTKPLLINAPMVDDNVFFQDVVRLVQRLIELEKENFETAIFPVEPHGFKQPSSWLDEYRRIYKLFEANL